MRPKNKMDIAELKKHKFIVLCYEHYTPLGVIRSLGEYGINPIAIIVRNRKNKIASKSKYLREVYFVENEEEQYELLINKYGKEQYKPFIYPCDDNITAICDQHYEEIKEKFYISNAIKNGQITYFQNKNNINLLAQKHGLNVARTWITKKGTIPEDIVYPVMTKTIASTSGAWKEDYYVCSSEAELLDAYTKIKGNDLLLQQYIKKKTEIALDGVSVNNGKQYITIASRYTYALPDNYSAEMIVSNYSEIPHFEETKKALDGMFQEIGYDGIFEVEFMVDADETLWFLEINFRSSTWNYAATKLGMNLPILWANAQLDKILPNDAEKKVPSGYKAMAELPDFGWRVLKKRISLKNWIKEVKSCNCLYFYNKEDMKPFRSAVYWKIQNKVVKIINKKLFGKKYRW